MGWWINMDGWRRIHTQLQSLPFFHIQNEKFLRLIIAAIYFIERSSRQVITTYDLICLQRASFNEVFFNKINNFRGIFLVFINR